MDFCNTHCIKCAQLGVFSVNFSGLHKACDTHYQSLLNTKSSIETCFYCRSQVLIIRDICSFCKENPGYKYCSQCQSLLCENCFIEQCQICNFKDKICSECYLYSENTLIAVCSHKLCNICYNRNDGMCRKCSQTNECFNCTRLGGNVCPRYCTKFQCEYCFVRCSICKKAPIKYSDKILPLCICGKPLNEGKCEDCDGKPRRQAQEYKKPLENFQAMNQQREPDYKLLKRSFEEEEKNLKFSQGMEKRDKKDSCPSCGNWVVLTKRKCEHSVCATCALNPCIICIAQGTSIPKPISKEKPQQNEACSNCNYVTKLNTLKCGHKVCPNCMDKKCDMCEINNAMNNNEEKDMIQQCKTCQEWEIVKFLSCGHQVCKNCKDRPCLQCENDRKNQIENEKNRQKGSNSNISKLMNNTQSYYDILKNPVPTPELPKAPLPSNNNQKKKKNKKQKSKEKKIPDNAEKCLMCNNLCVLIERECKHLSCEECLKFKCKECMQKDLCQSCEKLSKDLNEDKNLHLICFNCSKYGCRICKPVKACSNCGKFNDGIKLICDCGFLCYECSFLRDGDHCILHKGELSHCKLHTPCTFSMKNDMIFKECKEIYFCPGCKEIVPKTSEKKKHKKCFKK